MPSGCLPPRLVGTASRQVKDDRVSKWLGATESPTPRPTSGVRCGYPQGADVEVRPNYVERLSSSWYSRTSAKMLFSMSEAFVSAAEEKDTVVGSVIMPTTNLRIDLKFRKEGFQ
jgi:hypothetical protein